ncbi:17614_t:CDS:2, partial [Funneliformis geosporum]
INYIIHAVPRPRSSCASDEEFIQIAVKAAQNSIILADREGREEIDKLAICLIGGEIYRGSCSPEKLAEGIIRAKAHQLENELFMSGQTYFFEENNEFGGSIKNNKSKGIEARVGDITAMKNNTKKKIAIALGAEASSVDQQRKGLMKKFNSLAHDSQENDDDTAK